MGVYLDFLRAQGAQITEDLHEEFRERAVDLLWRGGLI